MSEHLIKLHRAMLNNRKKETRLTKRWLWYAKNVAFQTTFVHAVNLIKKKLELLSGLRKEDFQRRAQLSNKPTAPTAEERALEMRPPGLAAS